MILGWAVGSNSQRAFGSNGYWGKSIAIVSAAALFLGACLISRDYSLLVDSHFNDQARKAQLLSFRQIDLSQVKILDSLKEWQEVKRFPSKGRLTDTQTEQLKRVASRIPLWPNLQRLEENALLRGDKLAVCRVLIAVDMLYDQALVTTAYQLADPVAVGDCMPLLRKSRKESLKRYPLTF
jgi:hypothetical protein